MKTIHRCILRAALVCALLSPVVVAAPQAQDATLKMSTEQLAEHFAGSRDTRQTMWMDATTPPMTETGNSVDTAVLGGRQVHADFTSAFMGQPCQGVGFVGYDNVRGKYTNIWSDNMSTGVMVIDGEYDPATRTWTSVAKWAIR